MRFVLDACALIAFLRKEDGAQLVARLLHDEENVCMAHAVNLCEVYYDFLRAADKRTAEVALSDLESLGLIPQEDMDMPFWREAARYKAHLRRISLADCFALSLAKRVGGTLITSDHAEFDMVAGSNICPVRFIR